MKFSPNVRDILSSDNCWNLHELITSISAPGLTHFRHGAVIIVLCGSNFWILKSSLIWKFGVSNRLKGIKLWQYEDYKAYGSNNSPSSRWMSVNKTLLFISDFWFFCISCVFMCLGGKYSYHYNHILLLIIWVVYCSYLSCHYAIHKGSTVATFITKKNYSAEIIEHSIA